jgi:hypothetical protein
MKNEIYVACEHNWVLNDLTRLFASLLTF